jgi:hypothetical protein
LTRRRRVAVIGAGVAGLACALRLRDAGADVTVFERDEFPGGRAATLIGAAGPFDHGAQYFTADDSRFVAALRQWLAAGIVQRWEGRIVAFEAGAAVDRTASAERFVAVPGMRRLGMHMAQPLDVRCSTPISCLRRDATGWRLDAGGEHDGALGPFDAVVVAMPSEPAAELLQDSTDLAEQARAVAWEPCWSLTLALAHKSGAGFDGAFINDDPILGWAALDSAKPRRGQVEGVAERWVLHARRPWSQRYATMAEPEVARWMTRSFSALLRGRPMPAQAHAVLWRHAWPVESLPQRFLWDDGRAVGMAGDWCGGGARIEVAYLSGLALAEAMLQ